MSGPADNGAGSTEETERRKHNETHDRSIRSSGVGGNGGGMYAQGQMKNVREAADGDRVTVGTVQKEIRVGMSGVEVIEQLGSPNIVQTDSEGREVWIYDKFATESVAQESRAGIGALILGLTPILGGSVSASGSSSASSDSQRTLTVIIKFDTGSRVRDFSYHTSRF